MMQLSNPTKPPETCATPIPSGGYGTALLKLARRLTVFVLGISVLIVGIVMLVGPGPGLIVVPLGLAILATEFLWARRILDSLKYRIACARAAAVEVTPPRWLQFFLPKK